MENHVITWTDVVWMVVIKEHLGSNVTQVCWFIFMKIDNYEIDMPLKYRETIGWWQSHIYVTFLNWKACPNGKYGNNCQRQCNLNCGVKARCDRITGQCEEGCQTGWKGITCDKRTICFFFCLFLSIVYHSFGDFLKVHYIYIKHLND